MPTVITKVYPRVKLSDARMAMMILFAKQRDGYDQHPNDDSYTAIAKECAIAWGLEYE